ncbi:MAG: hypothetical protein IIZ33_07700 [Erysipelotrichaceae bacterium]|nr:hypothetical protein [Erysipelotrichaceae bacterium]
MKTYAQQWTENYKGLNVECAADKQQDDIHMALIKTADYFFRITYHSSDGHGLDVDELGSLVMGTQ